MDGEENEDDEKKKQDTEAKPVKPVEPVEPVKPVEPVEDENEQEDSDKSKKGEEEIAKESRTSEVAFDMSERKMVDDFNDDDEFFGYEDYRDMHEYDRDLDKDDIKSISTGTIDWEKEAKKTIHLETEEPRRRRKTIYELDSYVSSGPSKAEILNLSSADLVPEQRRSSIRYSVSLGIKGIARVNLSPLTQKVIGCVIGENVSTEYPWVYVRKEVIEDNIYLHEESSEFLPMKEEIEKFPRDKMLIGYMPSLTEEGQFYIILTEEALEAIDEYIWKQRKEHENRVRTAVYKLAGEWEDLGSIEEVRTSIPQNTRPLLEIEVVATGEVLNSPISFHDRKVNDQRDGYIELLPYRQTYENITRKLLCNATQVTPNVRDAKCQTILSVTSNAWVQYRYEYQSVNISKFNEEQLESFKSFLRRFTDELCDQMLLNATWDIYRNDYGELVRHERDTQWPIPEGYKEHLSFHDEKHVVEKVINDLCWHPLWTGVAFAAYTRYGKSQHLEGPKYDELVTLDEKNYVLVWSFNDTLAPKLLLECPREVTTVSANPLDGTRIVGGCANGQLSEKSEKSENRVVVLWHIPGKIEQVETVIVSTGLQIKYKALIGKLTTWMQETLGTSFVRPTAMSSLKDSQKAAITQIEWLPAYNKVDENGRIVTLPEDEPDDNLFSQFVTASEDGTIAFWDLKGEKFEKQSRPTPKKAYRNELQALNKSTSPLKNLDHLFKPHYILIVHHPLESRRQVITTLTIHVPKFQKNRVDVALPSRDVTIRRHYKNIIEKPNFVMEPKIHIGTVEGDFGCITWEGYDFGTGVAVNTEICKWIWCKKIHDGPVTHANRSRMHDKLIATTGGKIFAVWVEDVDVPLMWKRSDVRLTACAWGKYRPSVLILSRMDGSVEIWDLMIKSHEPCVEQSLSGHIITGIYTHDLDLDPYVIGFCDFNGILRVFLPPAIFIKSDSGNVEWMASFVERQIIRVNKCQDWQNKWKEDHERIKEKQKLAEEEAKKQQLEEKERAAAKSKEKEPISTEIKKQIASRWDFIEEAREKWKARELLHMQQVILEKKGLRKEEIEKQREPILKMRQHAKRKKEKLQKILQMQDDIFQHNKGLFMLKRKSEPTKVSTATDSKKIETAVEEVILQQEVKVKQVEKVDPKEEILRHFIDTQTKVLTELERNPFRYTFNWRKILTEGKFRRKSLDDGLTKLSKLKRKQQK